MTKKQTFAEKIAQAERSNDDSDSPLYERPEGITVEIDEAVEKEVKKKTRQKKTVVEKTEKPVLSEKKPKRAPSAYNLFVKDAYKRDEVQALPPKERFSAVASLWQKQKEKSK